MNDKYPVTNGNLIIKEGAFNTNRYYVRDLKTKISGFANEDAKEFLILCNGRNSLGDIEKTLTKRYANPKHEIAERIKKSLNYFKKLGLVRLSDKPLPKSITFYRKKMDWPLDIVYMEITHSCNLSCIHCYANSGENLGRDMDTKTILNIIDELSELGALEIVITGGEPLVRKDIFRIIQHIKRRKMDFSLFTNGTLLDKNKIERLKRLDPRIVAISLESTSPEAHNYVRGKNSFQRTMKNIKLLIKEKIPVRINTTIFKGLNDEQKQIENLIDNLTRIGVSQIVIGDLIKYGRGKKIKKFCPQLEVAKRITDAFKNKSKGFNGKKKAMPALKLTDTFSKKSDYGANNHSVCGIGTFSCVIKADGEVALCPVLTAKNHCGGNMLEKELTDIWLKSEIFKPFRKTTVDDIARCKTCNKRYECLGGCKARSYMYNKRFDSPDFWMCSSFGKRI
jgi:radical SAM protein with 4Fe4S-binding SPASM domain